MSNTAHPCYNVDIKRNIVENNNERGKICGKRHGYVGHIVFPECRKRIYSVSFGK